MRIVEINRRRRNAELGRQRPGIADSLLIKSACQTVQRLGLPPQFHRHRLPRSLERIDLRVDLLRRFGHNLRRFAAEFGIDLQIDPRAFKIIGQCILILLAYNIEWQKEWYLLTLIPTALIGKKDRCDKQYLLGSTRKVLSACEK